MSDNLYAEAVSEEMLDRMRHDERLQAIERHIRISEELERSLVVGAVMATLKRIQTDALEKLIEVDPDKRGAIARLQAEAAVVSQLQEALRLIMQAGIAANIALREDAPVEGVDIVGDH